MTNKFEKNIQKRLKVIEERKIDILMEIAKINNNYKETISRLDFEYAQLHKKYYQLQLELIKR